MFLLQGGLELIQGSDTGIETWFLGLLGVVIGLSLLTGFLTPIAAGLGGLSALALWLALIPAPHPNLFPSKLLAGFLAVVAAAVACLGPGAFSLDARLFGLREIIIPHSRSER